MEKKKGKYGQASSEIMSLNNDIGALAKEFFF